MTNLRPPFQVLGIGVTALLLVVQTFAANPFLPSWEYIPDGEPRVFGDRVYLYGSHDRAWSKAFCDKVLKVWSAPLTNLNQWHDHGISFSTISINGHADDVPYSDNYLYAPDVIENHGKFWLYAYVVGAPCAVAVSDNPGGPFKFVSKIKAPAGAPHDFGGWGQYIDPGVLVDDDGKVYLYWGYKRSGMAQLNPTNMIVVLPGTFQADIIPTNAPFNFFEACSPRKINGRYYMVYADGGKLVYATSDKPTGPFAYGGIIVQQGNGAPGGNIHGGFAQINGQWFIFYHRMTHNTIFSRKACVERVTIELDGSIKEVEQTSLGFETSLNPYRTTGAEIACVLIGGNYVVELDYDTHPVILNRAGSVIGYKYFDFGSAPVAEVTFTAEIRPGTASGQMELWLDGWEEKTGKKIGTLEILVPEKNKDEWRKLSTTVSNVSGRHALYFKFTGDGGKETSCDVKSFGFSISKQ